MLIIITGNNSGSLIREIPGSLSLETTIWLITLLANQSILIDNYLLGDKKELLTEEMVELLTSPLELSTYKEAIMAAMYKGTKREIESEDTSEKNA